MSDALIQSLQKRVEELSNENTSLKSENKDRRIKSKKFGDELEQLRNQVKTLATERDTFKSAAEAKPGEIAARNAELEAQLRTRDHRDAFAAVSTFDFAGPDGKAKKFRLADGVKPEAVWQLSQYKAEGETPDAKAVSARYTAALQAHPYLFAEATDTAAGAAPRPITVSAREGGPGAGKGTSSETVTSASAGKTLSFGTGRPEGAI